MATSVACGWAGATFEVTRAFGQEQLGQKPKNAEKVKCDGRTDGRTDQRTNGLTKRSVESRSTQLKITFHWAWVANSMLIFSAT